MTNKIYCTAPFNGITVRENGDVKTCCVGSTVLGNLNKDTIENILESSELKTIQNNLVSGISENPNCVNCRQQERLSGLSSIRQHYLRYYPDVHPELKIKNLDIRWNNSCNLGCIYCNQNFSSTWENRLGTKVSIPTKSYQNNLEKFILDRVGEVNEITLVGGEPMLMKQNAKLFKTLPQTTQISIITNISYDLEKLPYIDFLLSRPKEKILWSLSLENTGAQFEYVRNGAAWDQIKKNLEFLCKHFPNTITILMVYSILSAFDLSATVSEMHKFGIKKFTFQTYFGNPSFDVFAMPAEIQKIALDEIVQMLDYHNNMIHPEDRDFYYVSNSDFIIDRLKSRQSTRPISKQQFYKHVEWCNQWNQTRFQDLWPHVVKLVDNHLL